MSGQCLRTWHFCAPLIENGQEVSLMTVPIPGATNDDADPPMEDAQYHDFFYQKLLSNEERRILPLIYEVIDGMKPDALVGVNAYPAYLLARLGRKEPLWSDLNGWTMAEGQARSSVVKHDRDFGHFWRMEAVTLLGSDRFSTVSARQADALYGELAMCGRLNRHTFAENLATPVANAIYPEYARLERRKKLPEILDGAVPSDATLVLWSGGFNSWTDLDMLAGGVARAMAENPSLYFVCTGGAIHGHDETTYKNFLKRAEEKFIPDRWFPLGWVEFRTVLELHRCATVGLNIDGRNTETRFGARNRLTNMMGAGVPVLTTEGTEIAEWIASRDLGAVVPRGDVGALALALGDAAANGEQWEERAQRARREAMEAFAPKATLTDFLAWAENPVKAADLARREDESHLPPKVLQERLKDWTEENPPLIKKADPDPAPRWRRWIDSLTGGNS